MLHINDEQNDDRLAKLRQQEEEDFLVIMSDKYGIPYADLSTLSIDVAAVELLKEDVARGALMAPFNLTGKIVRIGLYSPTQANTKETLSLLSERGYTVEQYLVSHKSLEKAWALYKEISGATRSEAGLINIPAQNMKELSDTFNTLADVTESLKKIIAEKNDRYISNIVSGVFAGAIGIGASDIHIEPAEDDIHVRYRIDGALHEVILLPRTIYHSFSSRLKLVAGLKLNINTEGQDGRFTIKISDVELEIRVSVIPSAYGEGIVMRILNPLSLNITLEDLGISPHLLAILDREIKKPHGMILNTGPTGSGKTTTLYAFLKRIYSPEIKMMTIEDPIEYHMKGISQTQVETEKGYTFLEGLRAAMRQDPDVIMVGEIRDGETAKIAINAALTGHMVFSTLHTNTAAGAIPRLIDIGVTPKIIGSSLTVALAQRLGRKLCNGCKKEDVPNQREQKIIDEVAILIKKKVGTIVQTKKIWRAVGCIKCNNLGYKGRLGIFEAVLINADIEALLDTIPSEREIRSVATKQGILDMREDGIEKILSGITSFDEVEGVVDLEG